jgi:hypothetical protein
MDVTMIGIFIGLILTGMIAGIPIGQAFEHRRLLNERQRRLTLPSKEEIDEILEAREIS